MSENYLQEYCRLNTTTVNSSSITGLRPRSGSSCTGSTLLAGPAGALGFIGELTVGLNGGVDK
jgi:hypothetical protein